MRYTVLAGKLGSIPIGSTGTTAETASEALAKAEDLIQRGLPEVIIVRGDRRQTLDEFRIAFKKRHSKGGLFPRRRPLMRASQP